jgi:hypothetical protein
MPRLLLTAALTALALLSAASSAAAAADIEGVWSFNGGQVAVRAQPDGSFLGTVIRETRFSTCPHRVGEQMWIEVRPQADGSYWGKHQWFNNATCAPLPTRGNTAFRVLARPDGSRFLRVCFSRPETPEVQPTIAPDGTPANVNRDCYDSELLRPLATGTPRIDRIATLPRQGRRRCLSRRSFRIRLREPPGDALETARVYVNGRRVAIRRRDRITAPVNLRGLPRGRYTVKITATTVLGKTITGKRRYRTCAPRRGGGDPSPV